MDFNYSIGHKLVLRKAHPCGGYDWTIYRVGADIGILCDACSRRIVLPRSKLEKIVKKYLNNEDFTA